MQNLQEVFDRIKKAKKEVKEIKKTYKEALKNSPSYMQTVIELKTQREKKKRLEEEMKKEFSKEFDKLEELSQSITDDTALLSDIALNSLVKGEKVGVTDEYQNQYEPVFQVKFKKAQG
jgi:uncharacterized coiled-coil DUF342 family protein